ncbi:MAG TPA: carboxypeptidase-like regulatory domain-containing protein [Candidatus Acidoferrum sp.]
MTSRLARLAVNATLILTPFAIAEAGTVHGTVTNGTTGKPAVGVDVILIQLQGGMQPVANSKSDAKGEFTFDNPGLGAQPMLVRAVYHGINFHQPVPPGSSNVQVSVFEASTDAKTINVPSHVVVFQPSGATLIIGEEYQIENKSQPPQAYYRADGNFDFALPEKSQLQQVAASGPTGMPVVQAPIDKKNNRYSIAYAFRPGQSMVRYSYEIPYPGNGATVKISTIYPGGRLIVVAPPTMQVSGDGLAAGGQEQGMNLYGREDVPAGTLVAVNVSGTAPPPDAGGGAEQGQQGRDAQQGGGAGGVPIQQVPGRLEALKLPLIVGFVVVFGLLAILLWRKPVVAYAGPTAPEENESAPKPKGTNAIVASRASTATATVPTNGAASLADVDAAIGTSLDALKERLFRLELRHQAGTISEQEYAQERARAEKVLRDLVRG